MRNAMQPATKDEWIGYLAGLEQLSLQRSEELKQCIAESRSDHEIEQAGMAIVVCAQRIEKAKKALAQYD
jgi:hypothetical protein